MIPHQFAIAVTLPGATSKDIVTAAIKYKVHIIDKEEYDANKDYSVLPDMYKHIDENPIRILFVLGTGKYLITEDAEEIKNIQTELDKAGDKQEIL